MTTPSADFSPATVTSLRMVQAQLTDHQGDDPLDAYVPLAMTRLDELACIQSVYIDKCSPEKTCEEFPWEASIYAVPPNAPEGEPLSYTGYGATATRALILAIDALLEGRADDEVIDRPEEDESDAEPAYLILDPTAYGTDSSWLGGEDGFWLPLQRRDAALRYVSREAAQQAIKEVDPEGILYLEVVQA